MNTSSTPRFFQIIFTTVVSCSNCYAEIPNSINPELMQSITQENIPILGNAPSIALGCGNLFSSTSQTFSSAPSQPTSGPTAQQAVNLGVEQLYSQDTASTESQVCRNIKTQN